MLFVDDVLLFHVGADYSFRFPIDFLIYICLRSLRIIMKILGSVNKLLSLLLLCSCYCYCYCCCAVCVVVCIPVVFISLLLLL